MVDECGQVSHQLGMCVISLVPSWTETLIACDVNVVWRTRFCIHPEAAKAIPVVGGTKDLDWQKVHELRPDLLIVDREENREWMKRESPCPVLDTHVTCLADVVREIEALADVFQKGSLSVNSLGNLADRWRQVIAAPMKTWSWGKIPGELEHIPNANQTTSASQNLKKVAYVIWTKPWMTVGRETFIGDMLAKLGALVAEGSGGGHSTREKYLQFLERELGL